MKLEKRRYAQHRPFEVIIGLGANYTGHEPQLGVGLSDDTVQRIIGIDEVDACIGEWLTNRAAEGKLCLRGGLGPVTKRLSEITPSETRNAGVFREHQVVYSGSVEPDQAAHVTDATEALDSLVQWIGEHLARPRVIARYRDERMQYELVSED